jgi:iron complex outermembrane receptor protein
MWWAMIPMLLQEPAAPPRISQSVVVTAAAAPVPLDSLARAVTVITRDQIARLPAWSVTDVLRVAGSVQVRSRGSFGTQTDLSVRGGGFGQVVVLVDGVRLNDTQSGHHNADIPVAIERIERIEILRGTGSSLYGSDAVTGTVNVITRREAGAPTAALAGGEHGLVRGSAAAGWSSGQIQTAVSGWATRTSGFMFDREVATGGASVTTVISNRRRLTLSHLRNAFGANGFYGPSPSKEWTDQTLASFTDTGGAGARRVSTRLAYRTHGDHFRWDVNRPGFAENRHRSHAATAGAELRAGSGRTRASIGAEAGVDWLRSNNLGNRDVARAGAFVEVQHGAGGRTTIYPALRYDRYSSFGGSWSPSLAAVIAWRPGLRARASAGRAFRVPTFTERYYRDPAHAARAELDPERGWGVDAGVDWTTGAWTAGVTPFLRHEHDVIDWVRSTPDEPWQTANIRDLRTHGLETTVAFADDRGFLRAEYTWTRSHAPSLTLLSKYVADYAPHSLAVSAARRLPGLVWIGVRADCKRKNDHRSYCGVDARASRGFSGFELFVEVGNLFDVSYQEIPGVEMPPRWLTAGLRVGR